jgi:hypothetical protein
MTPRRCYSVQCAPSVEGCELGASLFRASLLCYNKTLPGNCILPLCGSGGTGRHTILRGWRRKAWGFKSPLPHQFSITYNRSQSGYSPVQDRNNSSVRYAVRSIHSPPVRHLPSSWSSAASAHSSVSIRRRLPIWDPRAGHYQTLWFAGDGLAPLLDGVITKDREGRTNAFNRRECYAY